MSTLACVFAASSLARSLTLLSKLDRPRANSFPLASHSDTASCGEGTHDHKEQFYGRTHALFNEPHSAVMLDQQTEHQPTNQHTNTPANRPIHVLPHTTARAALTCEEKSPTTLMTPTGNRLFLLSRTACTAPSSSQMAPRSGTAETRRHRQACVMEQAGRGCKQTHVSKPADGTQRG